MPDNADPKLPTINERLEPLTQTIGLIAVMQRDNEERFNRRFGGIAESIRGLVRVAEIHEHRLSDLEDGQQRTAGSVSEPRP